MFLKLLVVVATAVVAEAVTRPRICNKFIELDDGSKTLCYVKADLTAYQASKLCRTYGMELYVAKSSTESLNALVNFGKSTLGGNAKAEVYVSGRTGSNCQVFTGNGKIKNVPCRVGNHFVCELVTPMTDVLCTMSATSLSYPDASSITTPAICYYEGSITNEFTVLKYDASSSFANTDVLSIDMSYVSSTTNLPINIADNFPNLHEFHAEGCGITTVSYKSFKALTKVVYVEISQNQITTLDSNVWKDLVNLNDLTFHTNPISTVSNNIFTSVLTSLDTVYFDGCIETTCTSNRACVTAIDAATNTCIKI